MNDSNVFKLTSNKESNFKFFAQAVGSDDMTKASRILRDILGVDLDVAERSTEHFKKIWTADRNIIMKTMMIRSYIESNETNNALMALQEIFNITGIDALKSLENIKKQV